MSKHLRLFLFATLVTLGFIGRALADIPLKSDPVVHPELRGWEEPVECFRFGEASSEQCQSGLYRLAMRHQGLKQRNAAIRRLTQLLALKEYGFVYAERGVAYVHKRDYIRARFDFERAAELDPKRHEPWGNLAQLDMREGRYTLALIHITIAMGYKQDSDYYLFRADILKRMGKKKLAREDRKTALGLRKTEQPEMRIVIDTSEK